MFQKYLRVRFRELTEFSSTMWSLSL